MPCRSGSPHAVLPTWAVLALRAGATFSRTMTTRTIPTTARTSRSRFLISTSGLATPYWRVLRTPGEDSCQGLDTADTLFRDGYNSPQSPRAWRTRRGGGSLVFVAAERHPAVGCGTNIGQL